MVTAPSCKKELGILCLALALVSLFAYAIYANWAEYHETNRLCFYSPVMLFPWVPALCVLIFLAWKSR